MNAFLGANVYLADKTTRRRLFGKDYNPNWVGTDYRFFGGNNYGYTYQFPDARFPNWSREQFIELAEKSTNFGFYMLFMFFLDISTEGFKKAFYVFSLLFIWMEFRAYRWGETSDIQHAWRMLCGSSGIYGGLAGYSLAKYGVLPLTYPKIGPGLIGYTHGHFIAYNFLRMYMVDASRNEEAQIKSGNIDHGTHFMGLAIGAIIRYLI